MCFTVSGVQDQSYNVHSHPQRHTDLSTTTVLRPFFRDHPGEPVPEENFWTFWCKGRLTQADTDHPAGRHSIRTSQCPPPSSPHTDLSGYWKPSPAVNEDFMFKFHHAAVPRFALLSKKFIYCLGSIIWNPLPAWNTIHFTSCKTVLQTELSDAAYTP